MDVKRFLDSHGIEYKEHGGSVAKGNININCPWCGAAASKFRMGINLKTAWYGCWRNAEHRGKHIERLIVALIGCSYEEARQITGRDSEPPDLTALERIAAGDLAEPEERVQEHRLRGMLLDSEFRRFGDYPRAEAAFLRYLRERFKHRTQQAIRRFDLRYAISGEFRDRIIIPVTLQRLVVTWTSRSIDWHSTLRYRALGKERSAVNIDHTLFNYDSAAATGGKLLLVTEGPFDAMWTDLVAREHDCRAVGLHNMTLDGNQVFLLAELAERFDRVLPLLDSGEIVNFQQLCERLLFLGDSLIIQDSIPLDVKDPAEMTEQQIGKLCKGYVYG